MNIFKNLIAGLIMSFAVMTVLMIHSSAIAAGSSAAADCTKKLKSSGKAVNDAAKKALIAELEKCIRNALKKPKL